MNLKGTFTVEQQDYNPANLTGTSAWSREASDYAWSLVPKSGLAATFVVLKRGDINRIKRVINGKSYNTMTSSLLSVNLSDVISDSPLRMESLWQTKSGEMFMLLQAFDGETIGHCKILVLPVTQEEAITWGCCLERRMQEVIRDSRNSMTSMTLRLPPSLMERINKAARREGVSRSTWMMRKLEHAVSET